MDSFIQKCPDYADPSFFVFTDQVPAFLYYSHIPSIVLALFFALFLWFKGGKYVGKWFLVVAMVAFSVMTFLDLILWTNNVPTTIMFVWSIYSVLYGLICLMIYLFSYSFSNEKNPGFKQIVFLVLLYAPIALISPTAWNIGAFDLELCGAGEYENVFFTNYYYFFGLAMALFSLITGFIAHRKTKDPSKKTQIKLVVFGAIAFLLFLFTTGYISSLVDIFDLEKWGFIGLPIFLAYLTFVITKYHAFNIKLLGAQALVFVLIFLIFAMLFIRTIENVQIILIFTLLITLIIGRSLIRSVKNEVAQREKLQVLAADLERVNDQQTNLMHFITHQIKGFFSKSRNIFAMAMEGDFGEPPEQMKGILKQGLDSDTRGVELVSELLNATNIKRGTVQYNMARTDMRDLAKEAYEMVKMAAEEKKLKFTFSPAAEPVIVKCDAAFIKQGIRNLIDNSIKYTPSGFVDVKVLVENGKGIMRVVDSGVGLSKDDMTKLFTEGGRGSESRKMNVESTGYGLYIVKNVIEHHGGKVSAHSDGPGKGSTFEIALPLAA